MQILETILSPFIFIIEQLFLFAYGITADYGLAIVILSFAISAMLLPVFILIEKAKKKDDAIKLRMKPLVDEIKNTYKGHQRYYYLKTLNRQFDYSPMRALIPVLSLLLQIPFFIAAYQYLESYQPLIGESFLFINDLSQPDGLFGMVNILPIAMTVVNLITAYFYTRHGDAKERNQMIVVAGIFLVLLFNLPSGLVLYWTMNNVFSFFRLFVTNPEVFKRNEKSYLQTIPKLNYSIIDYKTKGIKTFLYISIIAILSQLNWAFQHGFNQIFLRIVIALIASFIIDIVLLNLRVFIKIPSSSNALNFSKLEKKYKIFSAALLIAGIVSQINWIMKHSQYDYIIVRFVIVLFISWFIPIIIRYLSIVFNKNNLDYNSERLFFISFSELRIAPNVFFVFAVLSVYFFLGSIFYYSGINYSLSTIAASFLLPIQLFISFYLYKAMLKMRKLFSLALFVILGFVLVIQLISFGSVLNIINIYIEDIDLLFNPIINLIISGYVFVLIGLPFYFSNENIKLLETTKNNWTIYFLAIIYLVGFVFLWNPIAIYSSYPSNFIFTALDILVNNMILFFISLVLLSLFYLLLPKKLKYLWLIFTLTITIISFFHNTVFPIKMGSLQETVFLLQDNLSLPVLNYIFEGLGFIIAIYGVIYIINKKFHKQIIVVLILLNSILIFHSLYMSVKTGRFVEFDNVSTSLSNNISFSKDKRNVVVIIADMFHGWYMERILKENPELKKDLLGFVWYPNTLSISPITISSMPAILGGYDYTIDKLNLDMEHTLLEKTTQVNEEFYNKVKAQNYNFVSTSFFYSKIDKNKFDSYLPSWHKDWDVFNDVLNIGMPKEDGYVLLWENALFYASPLFLKSLIYNNGRWLFEEEKINRNTHSAKRYNFLRLLPYISNNKSQKQNFIYIHTMASHHPWDMITDNGKMHNKMTPYQNNEWVMKSFVKWIKWMKENDVYDNTKIIIVSDHGPHWRHFEGKVDTDMPIIHNPSLGIKPEELMGMYPLLLVKNFNEDKYIKKDMRFMSNADVSDIMFNENNITTKQPISRVLPYFMLNWVGRIGSKRELKVLYKIEADNSAFDMNKWKRIE